MPEFNPELFTLTPEFPIDKDEQFAYTTLRGLFKGNNSEFTLIQASDLLHRNRVRPSILDNMIRRGSIEQVG